MTEYIADFAPAELPDITYARVDQEQAACIEKAMELPENQTCFKVSFLPLETPEQRRAAAEEWAGYEQAKGQIDARERGAFMVVSTRDRSPNALLALLEDQDRIPVIPFAPLVTHALVKVVKRRADTSIFQLMRGYYRDPQ